MTDRDQIAASNRFLASLGNALDLWAENNTRLGTWDRDDKVRDKIADVIIFFAFAGKSPDEIAPIDVEM